MEAHRQYINEWKSISDDVKKLADTISQVMWYNSSNDKPMIDDRLGLAFISGSFPLYMETVFNDGQEHFGLDKIDIEYVLYFLDSVDDYNDKVRDIGNSEYDSKENKLIVRGGCIEGYFNYTITQEIYHELNHAFEYGMGLEKKEDLYDKAVNAINDNNSSNMMVSMCKIVYYTFSHEQDAFAHQFYGLISSEKLNGSFEELVINSVNYSDFLNARRYYKEYCKRNIDEVERILDYLGMSSEQFNKRMYFGGKRFKRKLMRVYQRHIYELRQGSRDIRTESRRQTAMMIMLNEYRKRYPNIEFMDGDIKW